MKYPVEVTELSQRNIEVEADSRAEAERIAEEMWNQEEIVLNSGDFKKAFFKAEEVPEKIRVLVVKPGKRPERVEIGAELEDMQRVVGGNIQEFQPFEDEVAIICNEEGKLEGLPPNRAIYSQDGEMVDIVAGTFFICDAPISSETYQSLSEEQMKKYEEMFRDPEHFYRAGDGIRVQKAMPHKEMER